MLAMSNSKTYQILLFEHGLWNRGLHFCDIWDNKNPNMCWGNASIVGTHKDHPETPAHYEETDTLRTQLRTFIEKPKHWPFLMLWCCPSMVFSSKLWLNSFDHPTWSVSTTVQYLGVSSPCTMHLLAREQAGRTRKAECNSKGILMTLHHGYWWSMMVQDGSWWVLTINHGQWWLIMVVPNIND